MFILHSLFLVPSILHVLVAAAPIPVDKHSSVHLNQVPPSHPPTLAFNDKDHPVRHPASAGPSIVGHMPAHQDARANMDHNQLDEHARRIMSKVPGNRAVHAQHTPGHMSVRFRAIEDRQNRWGDNPAGQTQAAEHTHYVPANRRPHIDTPTMTPAHRDAMHRGLEQRARDHTWHPVAAEPGVHGEGRHGKLLVDPEHQGSGLTQDQLKVHANYVAKHLFPHPQDHDVRIHVKHQPGDTHATYHAVTADGGVINHHRPPTAEEKAKIENHVAGLFKAGTAHQGGSINGPGNPKTFTGEIPVHPDAPHHMSPGHMHIYSAAIKKGLTTQYGISPQEAQGMVTATLRAPGSNHVLFDTQPRHKDVYDSAHNLHPDLKQAHLDAGHTLEQDPTLPMVHADSRVMDHHLKKVNAAPGTAQQHLQGAVLGIDGMGNQPCANCHNVAVQFPIHYEGRERDVHPHIHRAIDL